MQSVLVFRVKTGSEERYSIYVYPREARVVILASILSTTVTAASCCWGMMEMEIIRPFTSNLGAAVVSATNNPGSKSLISDIYLSNRDLPTWKSFYKLPWFIYFFFSELSYQPQHITQTVRIGLLMFSHLNGMRATHGPGHVDRLFLFLQHMVTSKCDPLKLLVRTLLKLLT